MTRSQVKTALVTSMASVRRLEGKELHPVQGDDGVWGFDPEEVAAVAAARKAATTPSRPASAEGELAAEVFRLLNAGRSFREVVPIVRQPPDVVRSLYEQWREDGDLWVPRRLIKKIRTMLRPIVGDCEEARLENADDLVWCVEALLEERADCDRALVERGRELEELRAWKKRARKELDALRALPSASVPPDAQPPPK